MLSFIQITVELIRNFISNKLLEMEIIANN